MDGINAFYTNDKGLDYLVNGDTVAFIQDGTFINSVKDYHCKVHSIAPNFQALVSSFYKDTFYYRFTQFGKDMFFFLHFPCIWTKTLL